MSILVPCWSCDGDTVARFICQGDGVVFPFAFQSLSHATGEDVVDRVELAAQEPLFVMHAVLFLFDGKLQRTHGIIVENGHKENAGEFCWKCKAKHS